MRPVFFVAYAVMAVWLFLSAILCGLLLLAQRLPLDPLPFVSGGIATLALLFMLPRGKALWAERTSRTVESSDPGDTSGIAKG